MPRLSALKMTRRQKSCDPRSRLPQAFPSSNTKGTKDVPCPHRRPDTQLGDRWHFSTGSVLVAPHSSSLLGLASLGMPEVVHQPLAHRAKSLCCSLPPLSYVGVNLEYMWIPTCSGVLDDSGLILSYYPRTGSCSCCLSACGVGHDGFHAGCRVFKAWSWPGV